MTRDRLVVVAAVFLAPVVAEAGIGRLAVVAVDMLAEGVFVVVGKDLNTDLKMVDIAAAEGAEVGIVFAETRLMALWD
jgi:hypothetical protein